MLKPNSKPVLNARSFFIVKRLLNGLEKYEKGLLEMPCTVPIKCVEGIVGKRTTRAEIQTDWRGQTRQLL